MVKLKEAEYRYSGAVLNDVVLPPKGSAWKKLERDRLRKLGLEHLAVGSAQAPPGSPLAKAELREKRNAARAEKKAADRKFQLELKAKRRADRKAERKAAQKLNPASDHPRPVSG